MKVKKQFLNNYSLFLLIGSFSLLFSYSYLYLVSKTVNNRFSGYCSDDYTPSLGSTLYLNKIDAYKAWAVSTGTNEFSIGIIDSGINDGFQLTVPNLSNNLNYLDSVDLSGDNAPFFDIGNYAFNGHGTRVASLIGAQPSNDNDLVGLCHNTDLVSIKSSGINADIDLGIISSIFDDSPNNPSYCGDIPIMNMSIALPTNANHPVITGSDDFCAALNSYTNGLLIVSAGNHSRNLDDINAYPVFPASLTNQNMIVVGSSTLNDEKWPTSNYGQFSVDLFAPGESLLTPYFLEDTITGDYYFAGEDGFGATSGAAPLVAGTAALIKTVNPNLNPLAIKSIIMNNVDHITAFEDKCVSGGRLNTYKALLAAIPQYSTFGALQSGIRTLSPSDSNSTMDQQFYQMNVVPGTYSFTINCSASATCYLYSDIQQSPIVFQSSNNNGVISFGYIEDSYQTVYFKIVNNALVNNSHSILINQTLAHDHYYFDHYSWYNSRKHRAHCSCGAFQLEGHLVYGNSNICTLCGGFADYGFVGPFNQYTYVGNDSLLLPNGNVILGDIDYQLLISHQLSYYQLIGGQLA